jgi:hypothetical protein
MLLAELSNLSLARTTASDLNTMSENGREKSRLGGKVGRIVVCQRVPIYILMPKAITEGVMSSQR